jgi:hypothetical protein
MDSENAAFIDGTGSARWKAPIVVKNIFECILVDIRGNKFVTVEEFLLDGPI